MFNLWKIKVKESGKQSKNLDIVNKRLEYFVEILKDPRDVFKYIIYFFNLNVSKEKINGSTYQRY